MSQYEEREAARWGHYTWAGWAALSREDRVQGIAHYRVQQLIDLHLSDIAERQSRADSARARAMMRPQRGQGPTL